MRSLGQLAQHGDAPHYPVRLGLRGGKRHGYHEIRGVSRGGEHASPLRSFVNRTRVGFPFFEIRLLYGFQPHLE